MPKIADLSVTKSVDNDVPNEGDTIVYTITVSNAGPDTATNVEVTDQLPDGVTYVSDDGGGDYDSGTGVWDVGDVANGGSATLDITATVDAGTGGDTIINDAEVTAVDQADPNPGNEQGSVAITVRLQGADLSVTPTDSPDPVMPGGQLIYTISVNNKGPSDATGVTITNTLPAEVSFNLASEGCV